MASRIREERWAFETGKRIPLERKGPDPSDEFSLDAAGNNEPVDAFGNTAPVNEPAEKVGHGDGKNPPGYAEDISGEPGKSDQPGYRMKRARFWQS